MFQYGATAPSFNNIFNTSMVVMLTIEMEEILMMYGGLEGLKSLAHVADCTSKCVSMVVSKYPSIKGIYFYQPHFAKDLIRASGPFGLDLWVRVQNMDPNFRFGFKNLDLKFGFVLILDPILN
ncbi:hypothetical protein SAY87_030228 [Trapa incisa]|uniref:O-methyltransferase C-terminal domain-containing protein n=1 Tax=Trapa incisa TaxID=236973 RepID=A0AAN7QJY7_9MYRT|nr:hypothetical protein SAY87_030228 [Trapa incisa]